jgi:hypothetical protein
MLEEDIVASLWINMYIVKWLMKQMWQYKITSSNNLDENNTTLCTTILRNTSWQNSCFDKTIKIIRNIFHIKGIILTDVFEGLSCYICDPCPTTMSTHTVFPMNDSQLRRQTNWSRITINCTAGLRQTDIL